MTIQPEDINSPFTLEIDSDHIDPKLFLKATQAFCNLLSTLAKETIEDPVKWNLAVQKGSAGVAMKPEEVKTSERVSLELVYKEGLDCIQEKKDFPAEYPLDAIKSFYALSEVGKVVPIGLWRNKDKTKFSVESFEHLSSLLEKYEDYGAIGGIIKVVDDTQGKKITIIDRITGRRTKCLVDPALMSEALKHFGERVEVYGRIKYSSQGIPTSIKAEEIIPMQIGETVKLSDLKGILKVRDE